MEEELQGLDDGERAAIELAFEVHAHVLLLDERRARRVVSKFGFTITGTLGVLRDSHRLGFVDGRSAYASLCSSTNFHHDAKLDDLFQRSLDG